MHATHPLKLAHADSSILVTMSVFNILTRYSRGIYFTRKLTPLIYIRTKMHSGWNLWNPPSSLSSSSPLHQCVSARLSTYTVDISVNAKYQNDDNGVFCIPSSHRWYCMHPKTNSNTVQCTCYEVPQVWKCATVAVLYIDYRGRTQWMSSAQSNTKQTY